MVDDIIYQICADAYRITGSKTWDDKVKEWFYRNDFSPINWKEDYLAYLKTILSK